MSQTLIVHNNKELIDLIAINLNIYVGSDIIIKKSYSDCLALIENHPGIHLIVCADKLDDETTAESILKIIQTLKRVTPIIVLGTNTNISDSTHVTVLTKEPDVKLLIQTAAKYFNVTPKTMIEQITPDFYPVMPHYFLNLPKAPCPIYHLDGENSYQQKYAKGDPISEKEINRLIQLGNVQLFVEAHERIKFIEQVSNILSISLKKANTSTEEKVNVSSKAMDLIQEIVTKESYTFTPHIQEMANDAINLCMEVSVQSPNVGYLLKRLLASKSSFRYQNAMLIIFITDHIIKNLEWGTKEHMGKLGFAAFFHDICLAEDRLAKVMSDFQMRSELSSSRFEREIVLNHAKSAYDLLSKFQSLPHGADTIILQHHGTIGGIGFTPNFSSTLSPLSIVFIVAEEFSNLILDHAEDGNPLAFKATMLKILREKFLSQAYWKIVDILETITFE